MKAQTNVISLVIIAGMVIALVGSAYVWAVPLIEKRATVTEYDVVERFMLELNEKIVDIANTGSGTTSLEIPRGVLTVMPHNYPDGIVNNTISMDFFVSQPIIMEGSVVPVRTSSLDYVGEYGKTEPRIITLSRSPGSSQVNLIMNMTYRELRSTTPKGYLIALCPATDFVACDTGMSGRGEVTVSYGETSVVPRNPEDGGDLTLTKLRIEVT